MFFSYRRNKIDFIFPPPLFRTDVNSSHSLQDDAIPTLYIYEHLTRLYILHVALSRTFFNFPHFSDFFSDSPTPERT